MARLGQIELVAQTPQETYNLMRSGLGRTVQVGIHEVGDTLRYPASYIHPLIGLAQGRRNGRIDFTDNLGRVVATLQVHDLPTRPKDMPRHLRPKIKLSKRQRDAAKHDKLRPAA